MKPTSSDQSRPQRRRRNADERRALMHAQVDRFMKVYGRKAPKRGEPNDRQIDTKVKRIVGRLKAEDLDRLIRDDEE